MLLPLDWFQALWLWAYLPFAVVAVAFVNIRPDRELMLWIGVTPFVFWVCLNVAVFVYGSVTEGAAPAVQLLLLSVSVSAPIGFMVGAYCIIFAMGLFALFRSRQWLA